MDDEVARGVGEDLRVAVDERRVRVLERLQHLHLDAVSDHRVALLDVVRLVEHQGVRPVEGPEPQHATDERDEAGAEPPPEPVGGPVPEQAGSQLVGPGHAGHRRWAVCTPSEACEDRGMSGVLVLAATPIGDPRDAAPRLADELAGADVVAAEDTRRLRRLCADLGVTPRGRVVSFHEHNESGRSHTLVDELRSGARVVVVTDAGMPSVSDPGYRLVAAAVEEGVRVTAVPGPSAVLTALAVSGLPVDRFCFEGFLPRKDGERERALAALAPERRTMVFFEAPHRLERTLASMAGAFGPERPAAVCRELTKTYEEVRRGPLAELVPWAAEGVRGEVTVVVGGSVGPAVSLEAAVPEVLDRVAAGERLKDVCGEVAATTGLSKKSLYDAVLEARHG
ncbi:16S rRNA (cytidine(1402)-2'-O)-methyltransferase [Phycicoccus sp. CSK15P-2]|nr:16S rRNA (cytidine(1402)-2'-O)-methyltransferase [Phycicoccus sp. CSK15P-2]